MSTAQPSPAEVRAEFAKKFAEAAVIFPRLKPLERAVRAIAPRDLNDEQFSDVADLWTVCLRDILRRGNEGRYIDCFIYLFLVAGGHA